MVRKIFTVLVLLVLFTFAAALVALTSDLKIEEGKTEGIELPVYRVNLPANSTRLSRQEYEIAYGPLMLSPSYYDYFPGSYTSFPLVKQLSPSGFNEGGGIYAAYHATPGAGGVRKITYAYLQDGQIMISGTPNLSGQLAEGFPGIALDKEEGNPFVAWHGGSNQNPSKFMDWLTYDEYSMIGTPGLWNDPYAAIDNLVHDDEYIWPIVKVGNSPNEGMRRVFVLGTNAASVGDMEQGQNAFLSYADFTTASDLYQYNSEDWTHYEVPYMRNWSLSYWRAYSDFTVTDEGKVIIAGTRFDWGAYQDDQWPGGYSEHDALFVLVNDNYGEGSTENDWQVYTANPNLQVVNPDGYFKDDNEQSYPYLTMVPFAPKFTADTDEHGNVLFTCTYRMTAKQANTLYYNQGFVKLVKFDFRTTQFSISDLYPRSDNPEAFPYVPWDPDGDGTWEYEGEGEDQYLSMTFSWPVYWWDDADYQPENYTRIAQTGPYMAAVFQESMKARMFNEYGDEEYAGWASKPELFIMISDDYGNTWHDPIIMNANENDENYESAFADMIPAYFYLADTIDDLGNGWGRLHLMFYDQNEYGSFLQGNGQNTGGSVMYMAIDVRFSEVGVSNKVVEIASSRLLPNYPNPFNPNTNISFALSNQGRTRVAVYNVKGQLVKTLVDRDMPAGEHTVVWNGTDDSNKQVGSGVYFYKLETSEHSEMRKMVLVK